MLTVWLLLLAYVFPLHTVPPTTLVPVVATPPGCDLVAGDTVVAPNVIIAGRITGWRPIGPADAVTQRIPIAVDIAIDQTFMRRMPRQVRIVERSSLQGATTHDHVWVGEPYSCGIFDADPTGQYVIVGLSRQQDGMYTVHHNQLFYRGQAPDGDEYHQALNRIATLRPLALPYTSAAIQRTWHNAHDVDLPVLVRLGVLLISIGGVLRASRNKC